MNTRQWEGRNETRSLARHLRDREFEFNIYIGETSKKWVTQIGFLPTPYPSRCYNTRGYTADTRRPWP